MYNSNFIIDSEEISNNDIISSKQNIRIDSADSNSIGSARNKKPSLELIHKPCIEKKRTSKYI